jgi:hypothetical protein
MAATRRGQLSCAGLIDRYQIECAPGRDLLVDYLAVRRPAVDYTSLDNLARNLGLLFWDQRTRALALVLPAAGRSTGAGGGL